MRSVRRASGFVLVGKSLIDPGTVTVTTVFELRPTRN